MKRTSKPKPVRKVLCRCQGGPLHGHQLALTAETGCTTAWFVLRGTTGRYVQGVWEVRPC